MRPGTKRPSVGSPLGQVLVVNPAHHVHVRARFELVRKDV
jgi:hypothetical protein